MVQIIFTVSQFAQYQTLNEIPGYWVQIKNTTKFGTYLSWTLKHVCEKSLMQIT